MDGYRHLPAQPDPRRACAHPRWPPSPRTGCRGLGRGDRRAHPRPHRLGRRPVGQVLRPLQHRHQRQPRRGPARTAPGPERGREILITHPLAQPIADLHRQRPRRLPVYFAAIAAMICGSGSGRETGCTHTTYRFCGWDEGNKRPQAQIMARQTATHENVSRRVANKPPGSVRQTSALGRANMTFSTANDGLACR
jgi:hypothetical protein